MSSKGKKGFSRKLTRSNEDRINYIHARIREGKKPTLAQLMQETGFSRAVILKDIKYLRVYKNLSLKVSRKDGKSGYYYSEPVAEKIGGTFNEQQVLDLALATTAISAVPVKGKKKFGVDLEPIAQSLVPHTKLLLDEVQQTVFFRPFAPEEVDDPMFRTLSEGVRKRREIEFCYLKNLATKPELKRVRGYCFVVAANCWYMIGLDVEKNVERTYLVSRISKPLITNVRFKKPKFDLDEYLHGAFIVMKGNESHDIVLEFSPWARTYIENRKFVRGQKVEELPNGGLRLSFWLSCLDEVESWVRWWGPNVRVIGSEALRERLRKYRDHLEYLE